MKTNRRDDVYKAVCAFQHEAKFPPTAVNLCEMTGMQMGIIMYYIKQLIEDGLVYRKGLPARVHVNRTNMARARKLSGRYVKATKKILKRDHGRSGKRANNDSANEKKSIGAMRAGKSRERSKERERGMAARIEQVVAKAQGKSSWASAMAILTDSRIIRRGCKIG